MKKSFVLVSLFAWCAFAQTPKVGWSLGYYCGWDQGGFPPASIDWKAFTHISHFAITPNNDGSLNTGGNGLSDANCKAAVAAAHAHGVKIVICIGGAGVGAGFTNACSPANIHKFVANLINFMKQYGYDGIDTDWEESYNDPEFLAWHQELRDSINKITPRPLLTIAGAGYFASHCASAWPYVDQMNLMSYGTQPSGMSGQMQQLTKLGVPAKLLGAGIGIGTGGGMADVDSNSAKAKAVFAINGGFGGIMEWAVKGAALNVSEFKALEQYIPAGATLVWSNNSRLNKGTLFVGSNRLTGMQEIRFSVSPNDGGNGAFVDLSLFDVSGAMVRHMVHGPSNPGDYAIPLTQNSNNGASLKSGTYVVRLATASGTESAITSITK
jgi:hypothetical protein